MTHRSALQPRPPDGPFRFSCPIEVRFADTDAMGHVNNAVYLSYFEVGRAAYYRAVTGGMFGIGAEDNARSFIVAEARVAYRSPVRFGEPLTVECRVSWLSRSAFAIEYRISAAASAFGARRLVAHGETVQVMYDYAAGRPSRLPDDLVASIEGYEGRAIPRRTKAAASEASGKPAGEEEPGAEPGG